MFLGSSSLYLFQHEINQFRALDEAIVQFANENPADWQSTKHFTLIHVGENTAVAQFPNEQYYTIEKHEDGEVVVYMNGKPLMRSNPDNK